MDSVLDMSIFRIRKWWVVVVKFFFSKNGAFVRNDHQSRIRVMSNLSFLTSLHKDNLAFNFKNITCEECSQISEYRRSKFIVDSCYVRCHMVRWHSFISLIGKLHIFKLPFKSISSYFPICYIIHDCNVIMVRCEDITFPRSQKREFYLLKLRIAFHKSKFWLLTRQSSMSTIMRY